MQKIVTMATAKAGENEYGWTKLLRHYTTHHISNHSAMLICNEGC